VERTLSQNAVWLAGLLLQVRAVTQLYHQLCGTHRNKG
jgi:hypothetical protein